MRCEVEFGIESTKKRLANLGWGGVESFVLHTGQESRSLVLETYQFTGERLISLDPIVPALLFYSSIRPFNSAPPA